MSFSKEDIIKVNQYIIDYKKRLNKEVGNRIREYRISNNISIKDFSEMSLMGANQLSQIESGTNGITLNKFIIICNSLGCNPNTLLEQYLYTSKYNEDLLYYELQKEKNISKNVLNYLVSKE